MVIVCEKCDTRFQLDDSRVPAKGARVRCSRCKHAFFVTPPGCGEADRVGQVVAEATNAGGMPVPDLAHDLPNPEEAGPELAQSMTPARGRDEDHALGDFDEDWQFNEDLRSGPEPDLQTDRSEFGEFDAAALDLAAEPSDLETGEGEDLLEEPEPSAAEEPSIDAVESILARDAEPDSSSLEDLGSPEEWDLVGTGEVEFPMAPSPEDSAVEPDVPASEEVSSLSPALAESPTAAPEAEAKPDGTPLMARLSGLASSGGWVLVALAFAVGMSTVFIPRDPGSAVSGGPAGVAVLGLDITASELEGRLVENALAGNLLVVSGTLENTGADALTPGRAVSVQLVSEEGTPIAGATAAAGRALTETRLREQDPDRLRAYLERSAAEMAHRSLRPGERFRFDAVFESIPESAAGWVLQGVTAPPHPGPGDSLPSTTPLAWE